MGTGQVWHCGVGLCAVRWRRVGWVWAVGEVAQGGVGVGCG